MSKSSLLDDLLGLEREFLSEAATIGLDGRVGIPRPFLKEKGWLKPEVSNPTLIAELREAGFVRLWRIEDIKFKVQAEHEATKASALEDASEATRLAVFEERYRSVSFYVEKECRVRLPSTVVQVLLFLDPSRSELVVRVHVDYIDLIAAPLRMKQLAKYEIVF